MSVVGWGGARGEVSQTRLHRVGRRVAQVAVAARVVTAPCAVVDLVNNEAFRSRAILQIIINQYGLYWFAVGSSSSDQNRARVDGALCSTRDSRSYQHNWRGRIRGQLSASAAGTVQTRYRVPGKKILLLKEQAGFRMKDTTFRSSPWAGGLISWQKFPTTATQNKK